MTHRDMTRGHGAERIRKAEEFLSAAKTPCAPETLRLYGLQRVFARASTAREEEKKAGRELLRAPFPLRRAIVIPLVSLLLLVGGTSGVYAASAGALPGSALYDTKIFFERARVFLTTSPSGDARLEMGFCGRRMRELQEMLKAGETHDGERWLREYRRNLSQAEQLLDAVSEPESRALAASFEGTLGEHARLMEALRLEAPPGSIPLLEEAYRECQGSRARMRRRCGMVNDMGQQKGDAPDGAGHGGGGSGEEGSNSPGRTSSCPAVIAGEGGSASSPGEGGDPTTGQGSPTWSPVPYGNQDMGGETRPSGSDESRKAGPQGGEGETLEYVRGQGFPSRNHTPR
ncbi:MAG: DUF5667 domain-containing protein [Actinomycetota bacterium]